MNRLESQKIPKHWNAQFQVLKLCWNSYSKNHTYAYDDLNRLISANGKAKTASYQLDMTYGIMGEPLTKKQKVDSSKVAQSYAFAYLYEDSDHPTAPSQIGHNHYTYDANGNPLTVTNDSTSETREMYWDEDNRLMVLSDNGKTSRYTYNAGGERIIKSHGTMEGVYINGAPQGITFHEHDDYTLYPASIISINKNRFTKHYFIGDKRIASKIGVGQFNNVYGINGNIVTAGQRDYAAQMQNIEAQREEYYKKLGTPPGIPTMKGNYADPENTGVGYNTIIGELGDHSVPKGWPQTPKFSQPGTPPGPPVQWNPPTNPEDVPAGYGYVANDTTREETFFYHSDHLGSTSYITDRDANITQFDAYLPYGELLVDEHSSSEDMPYKFNGKELDEETGLYYYGERYYDYRSNLWIGTDRFTEKYPNLSAYNFCQNNPITLLDQKGDSTVLFATTLPGMSPIARDLGLSSATHTFLAVQDGDGNWKHFAYGSEYDGIRGAVAGRLKEVDYYDDIAIMNGKLPEQLKVRMPIEPPLKADGTQMSVKEFDKKVMEIAKSFGNNPEITYFLTPNSKTQGNCNTSSSTILRKAGVPDSKIKELRKSIPGIVSGFGNYRPWTATEQKRAVIRKHKAETLKREINNNFWSNWSWIK